MSDEDTCPLSSSSTFTIPFQQVVKYLAKVFIPLELFFFIISRYSMFRAHPSLKSFNSFPAPHTDVYQPLSIFLLPVVRFHVTFNWPEHLLPHVASLHGQWKMAYCNFKLPFPDSNIFILNFVRDLNSSVVKTCNTRHFTFKK